MKRWIINLTNQALRVRTEHVPPYKRHLLRRLLELTKRSLLLGDLL
jgi:hypothetical protein